MPFIDPAEASALREKMTRDPQQLGRLFRSKSDEYHSLSVDHNLVDEYVSEGWEKVGNPLKTKTKIRKPKTHDLLFEHRVWCQLYKLGYRNLSIGEGFHLPFGKDPLQKKQIDVVAVNDDSILLFECKSAELPKKAPSYKTEFEGLRERLDGFKKSLEQIFGPGRKVKYVFATHNIRLSRESADVARLEEAGGFFFNDNTIDYINSLVKNYKDAAYFQFIPLLFKGQDINKEKIEIPAIEGKMGDGVTYYMFSIEPSLLLKLGFVLHRTRANEAEMPTYQRLLVPSRLKGITAFIDGGGYFPNSVIVNFDESQGKKIEFQPHARLNGSNSRSGTLKVPNAYAIAYIIDGQHRVYGFAASKHRDSNTIPVVALKGLPAAEQLKIFMDINENQKAVSPTLRITLEEDLFWNSNRLDSRMKALRSSIISLLAGDQSSPLFGQISIGEDRARLTATPFYNGLKDCGLLPTAKGNSFKEGTTDASLYDSNNTDHQKSMLKARNITAGLIGRAFEYIDFKMMEIGGVEQYSEYMLSNRGAYAFIYLVGALNKYFTVKGDLNRSSSAETRIAQFSPLLDAVCSRIARISPSDAEYLLDSKGSAAQTNWAMFLLNCVHAEHPSFAPVELIEWQERQDKELQERARVAGTAIERFMKEKVIENLQALFGENWELEIGTIQRACEERARKEMEDNYKQGLPKQNVRWTEMFFIKDYGSIIEKYFTKRPDDAEGFKTFEDYFALDIGFGFNSKSEKTKWINLLNSYRSRWAHQGTKEKGLTKQEVETVEKIHKLLNL